MSLTSHVRSRPRLAGKVAAACGTAALLLGASACGSGEPDGDNATATDESSEQAGPRSQQDGPDVQIPGANGKVAAVDGSTAQVQGMEGQVAVTWNGSTTFTKQVAASLSDVEIGDCVLVTTDDEDASSGATPATEVTADTVRITVPTNGSCGLGGRGPGGDGPSGDGGPQLNGTPPTDAPDGAQPQIRGMGGAVGEVKAISATGFTVASVTPGSEDTTDVTVTVDGDTAYTTMVKGAASDVTVGICVQADGTTDDTGAVTAKSIAVTPPQDGLCGAFMRLRSSDGSGSTQQES
jgi:hypothetical protein